MGQTKPLKTKAEKNQSHCVEPIRNQRILTGAVSEHREGGKKRHLSVDKKKYRTEKLNFSIADMQ